MLSEIPPVRVKLSGIRGLLLCEGARALKGQGASAVWEPRRSGARGQTWPAQNKHRLEIKGRKQETQPEPEPTETTATENKQHAGPAMQVSAAGRAGCVEEGKQGGRPQEAKREGGNEMEIGKLWEVKRETVRERLEAGRGRGREKWRQRPAQRAA